MTTLLETKMRAAGLSPEQEKLDCKALELLESVQWKPTMVAADFHDVVCKSCPLTVIFKKEEIAGAAFRHLKAKADEHAREEKRKQEKARKRAGGGQGKFESHPRHAPAKDKGGQNTGESQDIIASPAAKRSGKGQGRTDTQAAGAQPPSPARRTPAGHAKATQIVQQSIWDKEIGVIGVRAGDITRHHLITLDRQVNGVAHVVHRLLTEFKWPDDTTPLEKIATADEVENVVKSGKDLIAAMAAEHKEVRHVR